MTTREEVVQYARSFLGVKFLHQGRDPKVGLDCGGLIVRVAEDLLNAKPTGRDYPRRPSTKVVFGKLRTISKRIAPKDAKPGDVVVMKYDGESTHLGILTGDNTVVHSTIRKRKCIEEKFDNVYNIVTAYWKLDGIED